MARRHYSFTVKPFVREDWTEELERRYATAAAPYLVDPKTGRSTTALPELESIVEHPDGSATIGYRSVD